MIEQVLAWTTAIGAGLALGAGLYALWRSLHVVATAGLDVAAATSTAFRQRRARWLEEKDAVLRELRDLDLDRELGKLSEADHAALSAKLRARARELIRLLDEDVGPYRARAEALVAQARARAQQQAKDPVSSASAQAPPSRPETEATSGTTAPDGVRDEDLQAAPAQTGRPCSTCGARNDADALFCKKCGARLVASSALLLLAVLGSLLAADRALAQPTVARDGGDGAASGERTADPALESLPPGHPPIEPRGPGDLVARAQREQQTATAPPPPDDRVHRILTGRAPPLVRSEADSSVPVGSIRVHVVDEAGAAVAGATVELRIGREGAPDERRETRTDTEGRVVFEGLTVGQGRLYRVAVPHGGAVYGTGPFHLALDRGQQVTVTRLETTRDDRQVVVLWLGTFVELRDERVHVVQRAQIANVGARTFVLPGDGLRVALPEGFLAFQSEEIEGDLRLSGDENGFRVRGSLPPGVHVLTWAYDLPIDGDRVDMFLALPMRTWQIELRVQAPPGLRVEVDGMPPPELVEQDGSRLLVTAVERPPDAPPTERIGIRIRGIPGPGPVRWIAVVLASALVLGALVLALRPAPAPSHATPDVDRRAEIDALLEQIVTLDRMREAGEVGPAFHARRTDELVTELALLLRERDEAGGSTANPRN
ncbi:MAG: zinc ribbon domain-containing protein [Myxococcota bacterium]|nr:zinc ribbon domain-containing protein [Myxococcota bacterium]MDW8362495.1 zinc ribbon domain-containing protein [Myxococcales bacterium]